LPVIKSRRHTVTMGNPKSMEINHIKTTLKNNGYPSREFREIERAGNKVGIKTVFSASDTLKKRLTHAKSKQNG
jgi:hypothetical protein